MSDWDPSTNVWEAEEDQSSVPPGFAARTLPSPQLSSRPAGNSPTANSQWDMPNVSAPVPRAPQKKSVLSDDWHQSVFTDVPVHRGKYHNEHFDQHLSGREALPDLSRMSLAPSATFHGDIRNRSRETITIRRTVPPRFVTNEHGSEEFHSEDIPVDQSQLQTTSTFRAEVDWSQLRIPEALMEIIRRNNFLYPSKVQAHGLKLLEEEKEANLLVQAPTGCGKTLTFILGTLSAIDLLDPLPQIICVAPTNELLVQLTQQYTAYAQAMGVTVNHISRLNRTASSQVLLATPLHCINLFKTRGSQKAELRHVKFLVLDEADHLLNQDDQPEFFNHMETVIREYLPATTRVLMFSATYSDPVLAHIQRVLDRGYTEITVKKEELVLDNIKMYYIHKTDFHNKTDLLVNVLREQVPGVTIVFINTVVHAQFVYDLLNERGYKCALLVGKNMTTDERFKTLEDFKRGFYTILITTNVLARGIDNTHVARVINYDIPVQWSTKNVDAETYLHRVGRSGRFNRPGIAITFVTNSRETYMLEEVKRHYGSTCVIEKIETDEDMREKVRQFAEEVSLLDCEGES